jgi:hypothetical protein
MWYTMYMRVGILLMIASAVCVAGGEAVWAGTCSATWIERGDLAFEGRFTPEQMDEAIAAYQAALPGLESLPVGIQAHVLNRLSQLCYERTTFSPGDTPEDREAFQRGKEYGLKSLRLNPGFAALEGENFGEAVAAVTDPAALLWTANNWGALFHYDPIDGMLHMGGVRTLYERCIAVDELYWGASAHNALGAMLVVAPGLLGGDAGQGRGHLERAVELDPTYLENRVVYAQYCGFTYGPFGAMSGVHDAGLIEEQLRIVLAAPIGDWPFWNREAKREAEWLLIKLREEGW